MEMITVNGVTFCAFSHIRQTGLVRHGFSTKRGGVSRGVFASMNLSHTRGDEADCVRENIRRMTEALGMDSAQTAFCEQVHGTRIVCANALHRNGGDAYPDDLLATDGLIADTSGVALATMHADCVPLFFLDPVRRAIGMVHAGWRGTAADIAGITVRRMAEAFGSNAADLLVGIGPSIGPCCFEVDEDVVQAFDVVYVAKSLTDARKSYIDLWRANEEMLVGAGVRRENIETAGICTKCRADLFYSHRRDGKARGAMAAFMQLI